MIDDRPRNRNVVGEGDYSELIDAKGVVYDAKTTRAMLALDKQMNKTISQLPITTAIDKNVHFVVEADAQSMQIALKSISDAIKKELGYSPNPLKKCVHCGQWGAVMCACPACGAPIDP